jgi:hypothetical protein
VRIDTDGKIFKIGQRSQTSGQLLRKNVEAERDIHKTKRDEVVGGQKEFRQ